MIAVAMTAGLRHDDPTLGIRVKLRASIGYKTWPEDAIAQFEARHPIGSKARLAFGLLLYTAQRRGDVIRMGRQHIKDGFIRVAQQKTGAVLEIPIVQELREILAAHPAEHLTFLTTRAGQPFTGVGFTNWFRERCAEAGLPRGLVAHGLRQAACRRLVEAGCSASQIAAISGHTTLREVERYTKAADHKRLATAAMGAVQRTAPRIGDKTEMVDQQGSIGDQGLYDTPNTAKPATTFVHNMTTILQDTTDFTPGQLNYSIANEPATVHDMLLQKSNGTFYLAIWDEQTSTSTTDSITVTLGAPRTVTEYDKTVGTTSAATFTNTTSIPLTLSDHAVFLYPSASPARSTS